MKFPLKNLAVSVIIAVLVILIVLFVFSKFGKYSTNNVSHEVKIGYTESPMLAQLYYASKTSQWKPDFKLVKFATSADIGYALISGKIDAAFMEPSKALIIIKFPEFDKIDVIGKITYPYGGALIVRKGLNLKMQDIPGHTVAISELNCKLYHAFKSDLKWLHIDERNIKFEIMPFDAMVPALETGKIDAAVTKSSYALIAQKLGHTIPYIQWDIAAGDQCCPAIIAQTEFLFLIRKESDTISDTLTKILLGTEKADPKIIQKITSEETGIPLKTIESLPLPAFSLADMPLLQLFQKHENEEKKEKSL